MKRTSIAGAATVAAMLAAVPVLAQTSTTGHTGAASPNNTAPAPTTTPSPGAPSYGTGPAGTSASVTPNPATRSDSTAAGGPAEQNPVLTQAGDARASKIIGSSVYNERDEKVGSVDDLIVGHDGKVNAILSVGGFLGMGTKYVEVPYGNLTFGNTQKKSDSRVMLQGATKESLESQPSFNYYRA